MNDFTTTFTITATPAEVFDAINDVRAWWGGHIEGDTSKLGDTFVYEHLPEHRSVQRITESTPGEKVVWHIDEAHLSFVEDGDEWTGTEVVFELEPVDGGTQLTFSHHGLVPDFECYDACSSAWSMYINGALRQFIEGRGADYSTSLTIARDPLAVYNAILDAKGWWNTAISGDTTAVGDEFGFEVEGLHRVRMRVSRLVPGAIVEWTVIDNYFSFVEDQSEWVGDRIEFALAAHEDGTKLTFTQHGLLPELECYDVCSNAWGFFVNDSLRQLAEQGTGSPETHAGTAAPAEKARAAAEARG